MIEQKDAEVEGTKSTRRASKHEDDREIAKLLENNKQWVAEQSRRDPLFFDRIGKPQRPKYLYIGCSDSRVPANEILGLGPGEVFVHRNVGNLVIGSDINALSVIEYAVTYLDVQHIIVTGHYDCGAVRASTKKQDLGLLENWIRTIRDVYRMHHTELDAIIDEEDRHKKLVEKSVKEQCMTLYKTAVVQRKRKETSEHHTFTYPRIHAMVFDPKVGILRSSPWIS